MAVCFNKLSVSNLARSFSISSLFSDILKQFEKSIKEKNLNQLTC